ncbi:MAG TPA: hypothetical protein PKD51_03725 [Saprospiraceae bacterium]|nr:hypothetical protein [Saprospiraceae bacterium]HMU03241.1 hypothetical protein [Saprospiraceae bacterium]
MSRNLDILNQKLELIQWISSIDDVSVIEKIEDIRKNETVDWWNTISENEKNSIMKGLTDANEGKLNPHVKARKLYEKWL